MNDLNERDLLAALRAGEERAFAQLVRCNSGRMLAVAKRILRNSDDANDMVQEAFLRAFHAIETFSGESRISTWLYRITVNACLMRLRSAACRAETAFESSVSSCSDPGGWFTGEPLEKASALESVEKNELAKVVRDAIDRLPDQFRTVVVLRDIDELSTAETARVLGIRPEAVKTRLHRARRAMRTILPPDFQSQAA